MTLTSADDALHPPADQDLFWTEVVWLTFAAPERQLTGTIYPIFRPNQNICSLGIYVWDDRAVVDQDILYFHNYWHLPLPADLREMTAPCGFSYRCIDPLQKYEVRYDDGAELRLELDYQGLHAPVARERNGQISGFYQSTHVTGSIRLNGEDVDIDCYEVIGRAWGPRSDAHPTPRPQDPLKAVGGTDTYAVSPTSAFHVGTFGNLESTKVMAGYLHRDGQVEAVVDGDRSVTRRSERGQPEELTVAGVDAAGRTFEAIGTCVNRVLMQASPSVVCWVSGTQWVVNGEPMWGEDHEAFGRPARHIGAPPW